MALSVAMVVPLAHATHWLAQVFYLLPVVVLAGGVAYMKIKDRRSNGATSDE